MSVELTKPEIGLLEGQINYAVKNIITKTEMIFTKMQAEGFAPEERLAEIATQEKWDGKSYGGDCKGLEFMLAGGLSGGTLSNLLYFMGYRIQDQPYVVINLVGLCLRKAMEESNKVRLLAESLYNGTYKCGGEIDGYENPITILISKKLV